MTCAHAVRVAIQKIEGVASVDVSLQRGHAQVELKPGNRVRIEQLWEAVRKQGLTPKESRVVVVGKLAGTTLRVESAGAVYEVSGRSGAGEEVKLEGTLAAPPKNDRAAKGKPPVITSLSTP